MFRTVGGRATDGPSVLPPFRGPGDDRGFKDDHGPFAFAAQELSAR
jgi:hypothetical protein